MDRGQEWMREHLATIGGTGATCVKNVNRFKSFDDYWRLMKEARAGTLPPTIDSPDLKRGRYFEDDCRQIVNEDHTYEATIEPHDQSSFCYNESMPWAHCLPDGWATILRPDASGRPIREEVPCEIKIPRPETFRKILLTGLIDEYMVQAQHNMMVLDFDALYFVVMNPVTLDCISQVILRDFAFTDRLAAEEACFFESLAHDGPPPAPPAPGKDPFQQDDIPKTDGKALIITPDDHEAIVAGIQLAEAKLDVLAADDAYELALERYKLAASNKQTSQVPGVLTAHIINQPGRETLDKAAALKEFPGLNKFYKIGKPFQQVRVIVDPAFANKSR